MKKAIEAYQTASARHIAAETAERAAKAAYNKESAARPAGCFQSESVFAWLERMKPLDDAHTAAAYAEERAVRIRKAAAYIAEQKIKAAAVPVVLAVLEKYQGKTAGPKTREKAAAEIAAAVGARSAYFSSGYASRLCEIRFYFDCDRRNEIKPVIYSGAGYFTDENNKFCMCDLKPVDVSGLPEDLEKWADEFDAATGELEAAKAAFEAAAAKARRVNLGDARLKEYRITGY